MVKILASMNTRLNIEKLDGNIVQKHEGEDHTFEVEPHGNVDHVVGSQEVQTQVLIYYHSPRDRKQHSAWDLFSYREDSNEAAFTVAAVDKIYAHESSTFNDTVACEVILKWMAALKEDMDTRSDVYVAEIWATKGLLDKAKGNVLGIEIVRDQSGYTPTLRVSQSRFYNEKLVHNLLEGHSILSLEGSLSGDYDVEKNDVGMLDKFDRRLQTDVQYMEALSTTKAGYMTFTEAWKKKILLKGLLTESRYELRPSYANVLGKKESPQNHDEHVIVLEEGMLNFNGKPVLVGKVYVVRAKEVTGWVLDFEEENSDESEDYSDNNSVGKKNWVESEESEYEKVEALRESTTPQDSKKETKMVSLDVFVVKILWGNMLFDFATSSASGRSGGILCVWDKLLFHKKRTYATKHCLCVEGGYSFTWSDKHASKMRKLDRFLVSQGMLDLFPNLTGLILHRHHSDHRPILLKETHVDYGHTLFRLYRSWFLEDDFHSVIEDSWNNDEKNKDHDRKVIQDFLIEIDLRLDKGNGLPDDLTKRANLFRDLKDIDHKDSIDLAQKAKINGPLRGMRIPNFFMAL
nr:zinc finger, CCHC-type [Tanacetum cinerariifolium]